MSNKTLEGMVAAMDAEKYPLPFYEGNGPEVDDFKAMRAALLWLADNVTDEMSEVFMQAWSRPWATYTEEELKQKPVVRALAAALRAAAGGGE